MKQRVLLEGRPGLELLHRISSAEILNQSPGVSRQGLILNPSGRILSVFEFERTREDALDIHFEEGFLELLDHFTFSERYTLTRLDPRLDPSAVSEEDRILALSPKVGLEYRLDGQTNPLEVNLRSAIADQKGCYPGQEVIEKILSLGSPARKLCLLECDGEIKTNEPASALPLDLFSENGELVGALTSCAGLHALAILRRTHTRPGTLLKSPNHLWKVKKES